MHIWIKVEKVMRKAIILMLCLCILGLTACGEVIQREDGGTANKEATDEIASAVSSLSIEKDGGITSTIIEDFFESYYDEGGLETMIKSFIDAYKAENSAAQIKLKSCKVKDGVANVRMEYGDYQAYAGYNGERFFAGTITDANMAGFDLNVTLKSVSGDTTVSKPELLGMGESHIVIYGCDENPENPEQLRINCFDEILYVSDDVAPVGKKSADVSLAQGDKIIVFK